MKNNEWINIKDRLPEKNGRYLVVINGVPGRAFADVLWFNKCLSVIPSFKYYEEDCDHPGFYDSDPVDDWEIPYVTHWMQLPELPEEVKRNDG